MNFSASIIGLLCLFVPSTSSAQIDLDALTSNHDLIAVSYYSHGGLAKNSLFHQSLEAKKTEIKKANFVGQGKHLWLAETDADSLEHKRGWMYRFRLVVQEIKDEFNRREGDDFIALVGDAVDVYVTKSNEQAIQELKHRFFTQFDAKIVFAGQIYCCNPWNLRSVARREFDAYYAKSETGLPPSVYKHVNAGLFMGYASQIIKMADEMGIWNKQYHTADAFESLMETDANKLGMFRMNDLPIDDDEWQIGGWFLRDQEKQNPLSKIDHHNDMFAITSVFRAREQDGDFVVFSRNHFRDMFGLFPQSLAQDLQELASICPFEYNKDSKKWTSTITGGNPLVFHFAGQEFLCACKILEAEGFPVDHVMGRKCQDGLYNRIEGAMKYIAHGTNDHEQIVLHTSVHNNMEKDLPSDDDPCAGNNGAFGECTRSLSGDRRNLQAYNPGGNNGGDVCFAGSTTVHVEGVGDVFMKDLALGDRVQVSETEFEPVYSFLKKNEDAVATFLQVSAVGLEDLVLSTTHMLFVAKHDKTTIGPVPAVQLAVGDKLVSPKGALFTVTEISEVKQRGFYAPLTKSGRIVANGVVASTFATFPAFSATLVVGSVDTGLPFHNWFHFMESYHRLVCLVRWDICASETYGAGGMSSIAAVFVPFYVWWVNQTVWVSILVAVPVLLGLILLNATELVVGHLATFLCAAFGAYFLFWKKNKRA